MNKLLHTPLTVHNVELANRLVMPPMATGKTPDGTVQDDLLAYYDARSKGGVVCEQVVLHGTVRRFAGCHRRHDKAICAVSYTHLTLPTN